MGVLSAAGSPLVAGSTSAAMSSTVLIRVERPFYANRVVQPAGTILKLDRFHAASLIASGKASAVQQPAPAAPAANEGPDPAPAPRQKGKRHARE